MNNSIRSKISYLLGLIMALTPAEVAMADQQAAYAENLTMEQEFNRVNNNLRKIWALNGWEYNEVVGTNFLVYFDTESLSLSFINTLAASGKFKYNDLNDQTDLMNFMANLMESWASKNDISGLKSLIIDNENAAYDYKVIDTYQRLLADIDNYSNDKFEKLLQFIYDMETIDDVQFSMASQGVEVFIYGVTMYKAVQLQLAGKMSDTAALSHVEALLVNIGTENAKFLYVILVNFCKDSQKFINKCKEKLGDGTVEDYQLIPENAAPQSSKENIYVSTGLPFEYYDTLTKTTYTEFSKRINTEYTDIENFVYMLSSGYLSEEARKEAKEAGKTNTNEVQTSAYSIAVLLQQLYEQDHEHRFFRYSLLLPQGYPKAEYDRSILSETENIMINSSIKGYKVTDQLTALVNRVLSPEAMANATPGIKSFAVQLIKMQINFAIKNGGINEAKGRDLINALDNSGLSDSFTQDNVEYSSSKGYVMQRYWRANQNKFEHLA